MTAKYELLHIDSQPDGIQECKKTGGMICPFFPPWPKYFQTGFNLCCENMDNDSWSRHDLIDQIVSKSDKSCYKY